VVFERGAEKIPYNDLLMPLETPEQRKLKEEYQIVFRSFFPDKLFQKETLPSGNTVRRAFVLERPPLLKAMFEDLRIPVPGSIQTGIRSAAAQFQKNKVKKGGTRKRTKTRRSETAAPASNTFEPLSDSSEHAIRKYMAPAYKNLWSAILAAKRVHTRV
jgi:hypothetical protein